ncbi:hypothetical protein KSP40_PGU011439 [Platanthera guangdongensis]|uniref:Secreted protein n=1 Tax=Platanthera guangdongensis TaxID=2320717 RepID=A0ABR2MZN2_9ASPA
MMTTCLSLIISNSFLACANFLQDKPRASTALQFMHHMKLLTAICSPVQLWMHISVFGCSRTELFGLNFRLTLENMSIGYLHERAFGL